MLGYMASEFFSSSPVMLLPIAGLALFAVAFTILTIRALRRPRAEIDMLAALPFDGEEVQS